MSHFHIFFILETVCQPCSNSILSSLSFFRDLVMTSTLCYLATGCSNSSRLILLLSFQVEKLTSVYRPEFFFHYPGEKLLGNTHVIILVLVSDPVVTHMRGSFTPDTVLGTCREQRGLLPCEVWQEQFL